MRKVLIMSCLLVLTACSVEPGSEKWCAIKKEQAKSEWSGADAMTFARNCLIEGSAVGSTQWCEAMADKPKGEWSANDTASYTKYCII
jgi:hypothetical protein